MSQSFATITDFLEPISIAALSNDEGYKETQLGKHIAVFDEDGFPDISHADMVLVGTNETRGAGVPAAKQSAADAIRSAFYSLYHWHDTVQIADIGNVKIGATIQDSYAALQSVVNDLVAAGKKVIILGGSHDVSLAQYQVYAAKEQIIEASCIDARIDIDFDAPLPADHFLLPMLTGDPNYIKHYNHIGFQSYMVHPRMLETIDKLRFDCYRVGRVKEHLEDMEPVLRNSHMLTVDIAAIAHAFAPANVLTPNGFNGEEICTLMQYAGMSHLTSTIGIYGYLTVNDERNLTAVQISHMLWYVMDGMHRGKFEASLEDRENFNEFYMAFAETDTVFLQSKRTGRWWMQLPNETWMACSYKDYQIACNNDIPERWLRAIERM